MKIYLDDELVFDLSDIKEVLLNDLHSCDFKEYIIRLIKTSIDYKYKSSLSRLLKEWTNKYKILGKDIPDDTDKFITKIFSDPSYKSRDARQNPLPGNIKDFKLNN